MKSHVASVLSIGVIALFAPLSSVAQTFAPTTGSQFWNVNSNWDSNPSPFPNASGAATILPAPTGDLTIDLGQSITVGSLTVNKSTTSNFNTTVGVGTTNTLTFDGGTSKITNGLIPAATGQTIISAPVVFNSTFTVTQGAGTTLRFTQPLSGTGGLAINRDSNGSGIVALEAANIYSGTTTTLTGSAADDWLIVRLNNTNAIPSSTNISLANSSILELSADNFTLPLGTGAGQIQFSGAGRNGWGAFGANRFVNLGGSSAPVVWGSSVGQANFGQLVLGVTSSTATVDFQNPLDLGATNRNIRSYEGSAAIDGRISGVISGTASITKIGDGVLSFAAANNYTGNTIVQGGMLRLDHQDALPATGNLQLGSGAVLAIGADTTPGDPNSDFARDLGTTAGKIQLTNIGTGPNQTNAGFSAHGGNRSVVLSVGGVSGAAVTWNSGSFLSGGTGTVNRHFILSADSSDSTLEFKNPIDLSGAIRTVVARNGAAVIDAKLSGVLSGSGASGLLKDNPGTLELSAANTYAGTTTIFAGVLLLTNANSIPGGITGSNTNNIVFTSTNVNNAGFIGLGHGNFTSGLGTGVGQVNLGTTSGFAAYFADRVVNLGGTSQQVIWGSTTGFVTSMLQFSAVGADATVDFQNPVDLNAAARTVKVLNGSASIDAMMSGVISGNGSLIKDGGGTLKLTAANTYDSGTTVSLGRLLVSNATGSGTGSGTVSVNAGTLGGSGFIKPSGTAGVTIASGAVLSPGESIGTLTLDGIDTTGAMLTLATGATMFAEVNLGQSDKIALINGAAADIAFNNNVLNFSDLSLGGLAPGAYPLVTADVSDAFSGLVTAPGGLITSGLSIGTGLETYGGAAQLYNSGQTISLIVNSPDFNGNLVVDAADYVLWRKNPSAYFGDAGYTLWRRWFGFATSGSGGGSALDDAGAVPEPPILVLICLLSPLLTLRKRG